MLSGAFMDFAGEAFLYKKVSCFALLSGLSTNFSQTGIFTAETWICLGLAAFLMVFLRTRRHRGGFLAVPINGTNPVIT